MIFALLAVLLSFVGGLIYGSFFEWTLHKFLMHRPFFFVKFAYHGHALAHHGAFGSALDYHLQDEENRKRVTMAWWNGPALLAINAPVGLLAAWGVGSWWVVAGFMLSMLAYYSAYEYLHWCMHIPARRFFQSTRLFKWVDQHHRLHHLMPGRNLNVVLPLADFLFRTRLARAPAQ